MRKTEPTREEDCRPGPGEAGTDGAPEGRGETIKEIKPASVPKCTNGGSGGTYFLPSTTISLSRLLKRVTPKRKASKKGNSEKKSKGKKFGEGQEEYAEKGRMQRRVVGREENNRDGQ